MKPLYPLHFPHATQKDACPETARFHNVLRSLCDPPTVAQGESGTDGGGGCGKNWVYKVNDLLLGIRKFHSECRTDRNSRNRVANQTAFDLARKIIFQNFGIIPSLSIVIPKFWNILVLSTLDGRTSETKFSTHHARPVLTAGR